MTDADHESPEDRGTPHGPEPEFEPRSPRPAPAAFLEMVVALRRFQDGMAAAAPPEDLLREAAGTLGTLASRFTAYAVRERGRYAGRAEVPGRGQALVPVITVDRADPLSTSARVSFGNYYLGGNGAAHGGAIPLVFDELLGRLAIAGGRRPARTAYLTVNYRSITPIGRELRLEGRVDREDGRKRFLTGRLFDGDTLCADAEGLFIELRPGQP